MSLVFPWLTSAAGLSAIWIGLKGSQYSERAKAGPVTREPFELVWDHGPRISEDARATRNDLKSNASNAIAAILGAVTIALVAAERSNEINLSLLSAAAAVLSCAALGRYARLALMLRISRAREIFDVFYYGTGMCKYVTLDAALDRFSKEHPSAYRIAARSIRSGARLARLENDRRMEAYVAGMQRLV